MPKLGDLLTPEELELLCARPKKSEIQASSANRTPEDDRTFTIKMERLNHRADIANFILDIREAQHDGFNKIVIDLSKTKEKVFPNTCVPIAAIIQYLRLEKGLEIQTLGASGFLAVVRLDDPLIANETNISTQINIFSRIWKFQDSKSVYLLVDAFVAAIQEYVECAPGVLETLEWSFNEVMDNVMQHSRSGSGYIMVQVHKETKRLAACIADTGIGIYGSLKVSKHKPKTVVDALTLSIQEGITRDPGIGQGNGLWGLSEIVTRNQGRLEITSGNGQLTISHDGRITTKDDLTYLSKKAQSAIVDFQLNTDVIIDLAKTLKIRSSGNLRLEKLETPTGEHLIRIKEQSHGTGTRPAAVALRNFLINLRNEGVQKLILDFSGIAVISSSFADELVGKLLIRYGFYSFQENFQLINLNETCQGILERSVRQRIAADFQEDRSLTSSTPSTPAASPSTQ